ncbi:deoxyuridine 5'-triphosphate nucleotidohydrolase [Sclerotinia borealis F-4128]|uniref:Deoxyuridine 5'-triphosphate nucleotidohydrolase n=1 Tax=Sclerotinia borealis (strain F-4128) TaxID=1432307 RepID=W9CUS8_SCLBF|nr:deoxyuridine 5'-triphosphate nucleotidohydrolase [Sclerotinia borealis F-4128]
MSTLDCDSSTSPLPKRQKISSSISTSTSTSTPTPTPTPAATATTSLQEKMSSGTPTITPAPATNGTLKSSSPPPLLIKKLSPRARLPTRGSAFAAGYDIYAAKETIVPAKGKALVDTDISMAVPDGTYGRIAPRSGLASKHMIDTGAGVIDSDYRGQVKVLLFNHGEKDFEVKEGDRVAQLILERIYTPEVTEVLVLEESVRGEGGFGSTG